jgi:hypothetical protein
MRYGGGSQQTRNTLDIERVRRLQFDHAPTQGLLAVVTSATGTAVPYQWLYAWAEAELVSASPYTVAAKAFAMVGTAVSISELGNGARVAYGVTVANLPAGFQPVQIPVGTPIWIVPWRQNNGSLLWLIINSQAVDGTCPP